MSESQGEQSPVETYSPSPHPTPAANTVHIILQNAGWKGKTKGREKRKREEGEDGRQGERGTPFFQELVLLNYNPLAPSGGQDHE